MFLIFVLVQANALASGKEIGCGCFGSFSAEVSLLSILTTSVFAAMSTFVLVLSLSLDGKQKSQFAHPKPAKQLNNSRSALSLLELLVVLSLIGFLVLLLFPAIQSVRESARNIACKNNLRSIGIAAISYESANQSLPPGNLGFQDAIVVDDRFVGRWRNDPTFSFYWKRTQHTSFLVFLMPFLENSTVFEKLPRAATAIGLRFDEFYSGKPPVSWLGELDAINDLMSMNVAILQCPSDRFDRELTGRKVALVRAQPVYYFDSANRRELDGYMATSMVDSDQVKFGTNYVACAGAHSGGNVPNQQLNLYIGAVSCRRPTRLAEVTDGQSNTVFFGESIGIVDDGEKLGGYIWCFGALARGRGKLPWGASRHPELSKVNLFGDSHSSSAASFGSLHPTNVNNIFVDGSVRSTFRGIKISTWYNHCGIADGYVLDQ